MFKLFSISYKSIFSSSFFQNFNCILQRALSKRYTFFELYSNNKTKLQFIFQIHNLPVPQHIFKLWAKTKRKKDYFHSFWFFQSKFSPILFHISNFSYFKIIIKLRRKIRADRFPTKKEIILITRTVWKHA